MYMKAINRIFLFEKLLTFLRSRFTIKIAHYSPILWLLYYYDYYDCYNIVIDDYYDRK